MRPVSFKLEEEMIDDLDAEADERDLTRSQYVRRILDARHETAADSREENESESVEEEIEILDEKMTDLSERVEELEERRPDRRDRAGSHEPRSEREQSPRERAESDENATESPIDAALDGWRPGRNRDKRKEQRRAGRAVIEYLQEQKVASAVEFREDIETDHPVTGQSPPTWWKKTGREALNRAQDAGLVEFVDGRKEWKWRGE